MSQVHILILFTNTFCMNINRFLSIKDKKCLLYLVIFSFWCTKVSRRKCEQFKLCHIEYKTTTNSFNFSFLLKLLECLVGFGYVVWQRSVNRFLWLLFYTNSEGKSFVSIAVSDSWWLLKMIFYKYHLLEIHNFIIYVKTVQKDAIQQNKRHKTLTRKCTVRLSHRRNENKTLLCKP